MPKRTLGDAQRDIRRCPKGHLEIFSVTHNQLEEIPAELGLLTKLTEINLANNKLTQIPQQLYDLIQLRKLCLARNSLKDLPEGILGWENLKTLDVAGNHLSMFPADFQFLALEELFFEGNNFVQFELFESFRVQEVFSLKELAARLILKEGMNKLSVLSRALPLYPDLQTMLSRWGRCALCFQRFLTTWLECVQFINLRKDMSLKSSQIVPVRVLLCSYSCFSKSGHSYYGVAKV
uniref:Leucine rich repeat containing 69 n=1 Tax=Astyanax mexicanus TaxID=7994 RepID=A0A3B1JDH1_ASTMX